MTDAFDLDAARAARAEMRGDPPCFLFGGQKFLLPVELPAEFSYLLLADPKEAFRFLLADQFDDFWAARPSKRDIVELVAWIGETAGATLGESSGSGGSSGNGSGPSRPTSSATTRKTSAKSASGAGR